MEKLSVTSISITETANMILYNRSKISSTSLLGIFITLRICMCNLFCRLLEHFAYFLRFRHSWRQF